MWLLNDPQTYAQACQDVMGATAPHVNISTIRNFVFAIPVVVNRRRSSPQLKLQREAYPQQLIEPWISFANFVRA